MIVDARITLKKGELTKVEWERLFHKLTFLDADENEVSAFEYIPGRDAVQMPRGAWALIPDKAYKISDLRARPTIKKFRYMRDLGGPGYEGQREAVLTMFDQQQGQVIAPPGKGKTEICLAFAASCRTRTLVVVHTSALFKQWIDRCAESVPDMEVGKIQGGTCQVGDITIAMAQTLKRYIRAGGKFWRQWGALIIDEAHHAAAETWEWLLNSCPAFFRFGVTASKKRSDGRQRLVKYLIGPYIYEFDFEPQVPMTVIPYKTGFKSKWSGTQWSRLMHGLIRDEERNALVAKIAAKWIEEGHSVLVLSRQIKHLELIHEAMGKAKDAKVVTGRLPRRVQEDYNERLRDGSLRCILGTQLYEEGVDIPRLNRIILAFPGTDITVLQKVGRGGRQFEGKTETLVADLVDHKSATLVKQYVQRKAWYKRNNVKVERVVPYAKKGNFSRRAKEGRRKLLGTFKVARPERA